MTVRKKRHWTHQSGCEVFRLFYIDELKDLLFGANVQENEFLYLNLIPLAQIDRSMSAQTPEDIIASLEAKLATIPAEDLETAGSIKFLIRQVRSAMRPEAIEMRIFNAKLAAALEALDWPQIKMLVANPGTVTKINLKITDSTLPIFELLETAPFTTVSMGCDFTTPAHFETVANWMRANSQLEVLQLCDSNLGCEGAQIIAGALDTARLKVLALNQNQIGDKGGEALATALVSNTNLTFVNLVSNKLGPVAGKSFSQMLCHNTTLKELILSDNPLGNQGLADVMESLHSNTTLRMLGLMTIGASDFGPITSMLGSNNTLRSLYLNQNQFQLSDADALLDALTQNTSIECLDLNLFLGIKCHTQEQINTLCFRNKVSHDHQSDPGCLVRTQNAISI